MRLNVTTTVVGGPEEHEREKPSSTAHAGTFKMYASRSIAAASSRSRRSATQCLTTARS